jgi:CRP/FNR family transcriptional regulator
VKSRRFGLFPGRVFGYGFPMPQSSELHKRAVILNSLRSCALFSGFPGEDLQRVADLATVKVLEPGACLVREGEASMGFFVVQKGRISFSRDASAGAGAFSHVYAAGESFAEASLAEEAGHSATALALEASQVLMIQRAGFLALLRRQPELALRMVGSMSDRLAQRTASGA